MVIRHIKSVFGRFSGDATLTRPQDRINNSPPVPQGEWQLIVDREGNPVTDRKPNENDFLARRPIDYLYGGTIPKYNAQDYKNYAEQSAAALDNTVRDFRNKVLLDKAVFLLSQTNDGRRLLSLAKKEGFTFVFDTDYMENEGASGIIDYSKKLISLKESHDAEGVALTAKHELQHLEDMKEGVTYNHLHTIKSATMAQRALEANARVSESVAAIELYEGDPSGPEQQFKSSSLYASLFRNTPIIAQAAHKGINAFRQGNMASFATSVFKSYFTMDATLDYYDTRLAKMIHEKTHAEPDKIFDPANKEFENTRQYFRTRENYIEFTKNELKDIASNDSWSNDQDTLKERIKITGKTYLQGDSIDLSSPKLTALSDSAKKSFDPFLKIVEPLIPEKLETLQTNLFASTRTPSNVTLTPSPFALQEKGTDTQFQPIKFPDRVDGHELTSGVKSNANIKEVFGKYWNDACNYPSQLDRMNISIWLYNHDAPNNIRGSMGDLIEAGLRVPIAALPQEYLIHLSRCTKHLAETSRSDFSKQDITLMQHWKDMADNGYNPVYGTKLNDPKATADNLKNMASVFHDESDVYFNQNLKPFIDKIMPATKTVTAAVALQA